MFANQEPPARESPTGHETQTTSSQIDSDLNRRGPGRGGDAAAACREGSIVAFVLVTKPDPSPVSSLAPEEDEAIRRVVGGAGNEALEALALAVMKDARARGLWLWCDCRSEDGRRPVVAPCCNHRGTDYWRTLGGRHLPHDENCIFVRTHARRRDARLWNRPPRKAPEGYFGVLRDRVEEQRVSQPGGRSENGGERTGVRRSAMSQRLLMLIERTGLNRLPQAGAAGDAERWVEAIRERATEIEIAPGRLLSDLWFPHIRMWNGELVHARGSGGGERLAGRPQAAGVPLLGRVGCGCARCRHAGKEEPRRSRLGGGPARSRTQPGPPAVPLPRGGGLAGRANRIRVPGSLCAADRVERLPGAGGFALRAPDVRHAEDHAEGLARGVPGRRGSRSRSRCSKSGRRRGRACRTFSSGRAVAATSRHSWSK